MKVRSSAMIPTSEGIPHALFDQLPLAEDRVAQQVLWDAIAAHTGSDGTIAASCARAAERSLGCKSETERNARFPRAARLTALAPTCCADTHAGLVRLAPRRCQSLAPGRRWTTRH